jgi:hypothetical protein
MVTSLKRFTIIDSEIAGRGNLKMSLG